MSVRRFSGRRALGLPALAIALTPKLVCPACWPAYAALLSALGLGFIPTAPYLFPLTVFFLSVALAPLALAAWSKRRPIPFVLGVLASIAIVTAKCQLDSKLMTYAGIGLFVAAWLLPRRATPSCPSCAPGGQSVIQPEREGAR